MSKSERIREYFDNTESYLGSNPVISLRKKIINELIGEQKNKQFLDIGCGNGKLSLDFISANQITFLDISQNMLDIVRKSISGENLGNAKFENLDISLFKPQQKFDIVICVGVIAHVESMSDLLNKISEITAPEGLIVLQFTANEKLLSKVNNLRYKYFSNDNYKYEVNRISSSRMNALIESLGIKIIKRVKHFPISPLFSLFNYQKKLRLLDMSYKNHLLSYFGSETILLLSNSYVN
jgi:cyclopropane fatty-acyl-phospholipid synthase-like methyltransferase